VNGLRVNNLRNLLLEKFYFQEDLMKKIILIILLPLVYIHAESCIDINEKYKILESIQNNNKYYLDVKNYIQCINKENKLEQFVCKDKDFLLMFKLLSQASVYAYENATKQEVNHQTFNKTNMHWKIHHYMTQSHINTDKLCFDVKDVTTSTLGSDSPYINVKLNSEQQIKTYFLQENRHGVVLKSRDGHKIYLGKNCDVLDNRGVNGLWSRDKDKYTIFLAKKRLYFDEENLNLKKYKCY